MRLRHLLLVFCMMATRLALGQVASLVKDINPQSESAFSLYGQNTMISFGKYLLFTANNSVDGNELWISDGTEAGTRIVKNIFPGDRTNSSNPLNYLVHNGIAIFEANDDASGKIKLYRTNGTEKGTFPIWDRGYYDVGSPLGVYRTTFVRDTTLYMLTDYPRNNPALVVKSLNGPDVRVVLDKNLNPAIGSFPLRLGTGDQPLAIFDKRWLFIGSNTSTGERTLYVSDETKAGTVPIKLLNSQSQSIITSSTTSGVLGFFAYDDGSTGSELWKTDGTLAGTRIVKNIAPGGMSGVFTGIFDYSAPMNNGIIFLANDGVTGQEVWFSDGTETGTNLIKEFTSGGGGSFPSILTLTDDGKPYLYNSSELWRTDGTAVGTKLITKVNLGNSNVNSSSFKKVGDNLYCLSLVLKSTYSSTYDIVKINTKTDVVTIAGRLVRDETFINKEFAVTENALFYIGYDNSTGYELWKFPLCAHSAKINTPNGASFCPGSSVSIIGEGTGSTGSYTYNWKQDISNAGTNATLAVNKAGIYTVEIADSKGCVVSTSIEITQTTNLPVTITGASAFCAGQATPLSVSATGGSGSYTYQWRLGGSPVPGATSSTLSATVGGAYSVSVVDARGCTGISTNLTVAQKPSPTASITTTTGSTTYLTGNSVTLSTPTATGQTYQWLKDNQPISGATNNTYVANLPGSYVVSVTKDGCSTTSPATVINLITALEPGASGIGMEISPNPTSDVCRIKLMLETTAPAEVQLLDASGKPMRQWASGKAARIHEITFSLTDLPAGFYIVQATVNNRRSVAKLLRH